jgi:hypothetical protein
MWNFGWVKRSAYRLDFADFDRFSGIEQHEWFENGFITGLKNWFLKSGWCYLLINWYYWYLWSNWSADFNVNRYCQRNWLEWLTYKKIALLCWLEKKTDIYDIIDLTDWERKAKEFEAINWNVTDIYDINDRTEK